MSEPIRTLALAERLDDLRAYEEERLAEFARLMLRTARDLDAFVRNQEAISASAPRKRKAD